MLDYLIHPALLSTLGVTGWITMLIWLALLAAKVVALLDAARSPAAAFVSAGKHSRQLWLVLTALSLAFHLITGPVQLLNIAGTVASLVYLADVRPALQQVRGRRRGGSASGPYGPW